MHVELLGLPRERAGVSSLELQAETLGELLSSLGDRFPNLRELIARDGFRPSILASLNGERFVTDPLTPLHDHDHILILSADAGG